MKKIIPFNNVLEFNTDVKEITAISLEHEIKKYPDMISGVFYITGEYKITEGLIEREKFNFELPFDIALTNNYKLESLLVDIDDFRYDLISDKKLKVNIDLYIDGETINLSEQKIDLPEQRNIYTEELPIKNENADKTNLTIDSIKDIPNTNQEDRFNEEQISNELFAKLTKDNEKINKSYEIKKNEEDFIDLPVKDNKNQDKKTQPETDIETDIDDDIINPERIDLLKDMLTNDKENNMNEDSNLNNDNTNNSNENINTNIFIPSQEEERYVTYRVYKVTETDTIDSIVTKYNVTKEMLSDYNNIENIIPGDKLIIPTKASDEK